MNKYENTELAMDNMKESVKQLGFYVEDVLSYLRDVEYALDRLEDVVEHNIEESSAPVAKYDICISKAFGENTIKIRCATERALLWMEKEAPKFGKYLDFDEYNYLELYPEFDQQEVVEYLCHQSFRSKIDLPSKLDLTVGSLDLNLDMNTFKYVD